MFKRALICTDLSDSLQRLVNFVPDLAKAGLEHVVFFHSVPLMTSREIPCADDEKIRKATEILSQAKTSVPEGLTVEIEVASGRASDNIVRAAKKHQSDIVFSGMPAHSALNEKIFGSTTMGLVDSVNLPILIVRPQLISTYREAELSHRLRNIFNYLLLPYDGSDSAKHLLNEIKSRIQADPDCALETCLLSWIVDNRGRIATEDLIEAARREIDEAKSALEGFGTEIKTEILTEVRSGNAIKEILNSGNDHDITAIAVYSGKSGGILDFAVPSFTDALLRASWHPIVHFPRQK